MPNPFLFSEHKAFLSAEEIRAFQEQKLNEHLSYLQQHSPFYREHFLTKGLKADGTFKLSDLGKLPTTSKEDLQLRNMDFLCVPQEKVLEYVTTTGTTGQPVTIALTENDLERLAYNEYVSFQHMGLTASDTILLTVTNDRCFMAGKAYSLGARKLGAAIVRTGPGLPELQWDTILRLKPSVLVAVPSFILKMIDYAEKHGIDYRSSSIKKALCVGETLRTADLQPNELAKRVTNKWGIQLFSTYASTEMATAFTECTQGNGGHLNPELLIVECVDENGQPVPDGQNGEIVITTLGIEGMPLLRFRTGDIACLHAERCSCGSFALRIGPIIGRNKQMVKFKGTTLYPPAIKEVMHGLSLDDHYFVEASLDELGMDKLTLFVSEEMQVDEKLLKDAFKSKLRVVPYVQFVPKVEVDKIRLNPKARKPVDFLDKRTFDTQ
jgi:phenylacetate-CoA ligase